jgi:hypothetical protein
MLEEILTEGGYAVDLLRPPTVLGGLPFLRVPSKEWIGYIDKYVIAPLYFRWRLQNADICHICDHSNAMYIRCA